MPSELITPDLVRLTGKKGQEPQKIIEMFIFIATVILYSVAREPVNQIV
tara:strand:- start:23 stop:169 length:147 start_codon:yes stop_codon:yes gene_type:complete